ncbi:uncharacterized protein C8R40DRAFT_107499 [Lentinula edodes]|uniref:uncharacterized protein n=1 Tax=Lentinula edodes TaxID=5353 RepID=UPI001E8E003F|nr:uncharacterized protein C8R40DRAFT_107499 [Lentinula edodes]KAH7876637.1 hypothetical protein C8R40DRAFT_107499 [Lentinula edodes]
MHTTSFKLYLTLLLLFTSLTWTFALPTKNVAFADLDSLPADHSSDNLNHAISNVNSFPADTLSTDSLKATARFTGGDQVDEGKLKLFKDAVQSIMDTASPHLTVQGITITVTRWQDYPKAILSSYCFYVNFEQSGHFSSFQGTISDRPYFIETWPTKRELTLSGELRNLQSNKIIISFRKGRYQLGRWNREEVGEKMVSGSGPTLEATVNFNGRTPAVPDRYIQESAKFAAITVLNAAPKYLQGVSTIRILKWDGYPVADQDDYFHFDVRFQSKVLNPTTGAGKHELEVVNGIYNGRCKEEEGKVTGRLTDPAKREVVSIIRGRIGQASETIRKAQTKG